MGPTLGRCPVKVPIRGLDQTCLGGGTVGLVEGVQRGQRTCWSDFKNRAIVEPAGARCPVEVPISGLHQPRGWVFAVPASAFGTKTVERGQRATGCDFKNRACGTGPTAPIRSPVKTPIGSLRQRRSWRTAIGVIKAN